MTGDDTRGMTRAALAVIGAIVLAGCGGEGPTGSVAPPGGSGPAPAAGLAFRTPPEDAELGSVLAPIEVEIRDAAGNRVSTATDAVTLALAANPGGATLGGTTTVNARSGVATFDDLALDRAGTDYTLEAVSGSLAPATSTAFRVALTFARVSGGSSHSCAVRPDGAAYCWGNNSLGQLGNGDETDDSETRPVPVSGGLRFGSVVVGNAQTCAVRSDGPAYCWGANDFGQLGDGTILNRASPVRVPNAGGSAVAVGGFHACVADGIAICWGRNDVGQVGDGSGEDRLRPVSVKTSQALVGVAAGFLHSCALTFDGEAYCWGSNSDGQLGDGSTTDRDTPVAAASGLRFERLTAGTTGDHTCGLTAEGVAYCWGKNDHGQLGDGTRTSRATPVVVQGGLVFMSLTAGGFHTCGLTADGAAYCWGANMLGQLGDGSVLIRDGLVRVGGGIAFADISAGGSHSCAVSTDGVAHCWGSNRFGELGDGTKGNRAVPTPVADP